MQIEPSSASNGQDLGLQSAPQNQVKIFATADAEPHTGASTQEMSEAFSGIPGDSGPEISGTTIALFGPGQATLQNATFTGISGISAAISAKGRTQGHSKDISGLSGTGLHGNSGLQGRQNSIFSLKTAVSHNSDPFLMSTSTHDTSATSSHPPSPFLQPALPNLAAQSARNHQARPIVGM
jgi:hypothetical protein